MLKKFTFALAATVCGLSYVAAQDLESLPPTPPAALQDAEPEMAAPTPPTATIEDSGDSRYSAGGYSESFQNQGGSSYSGSSGSYSSGNSGSYSSGNCASCQAAHGGASGSASGGSSGYASGGSSGYASGGSSGYASGGSSGYASGGASSTWYDPYYYGYYGNFYPNYGNFPQRGLPRGYNYFRRWQNLESPGSMTSLPYPYFYQAHFAAHPEQYFYPYNYYPVYYYYPEPSSYYYYQYPTAPVIVTQPYAPLTKNEVEADLEVAPTDQKFTALQVARAASRQAHKAGYRFVSTDGFEPELPQAAAEEASAQLMFANGFHAYWRQDYEGALKELKQAIAANRNDARAWYYQGLSELALGDENAAVNSFGQAVQLHVDHPEQATAINRVLERVQGDIRLELHRARQQAVLKRTAQPDLEG
ncbi:tetratricopeptide repeat protein [Lignipirellula cremea]|uniref:Uncharacterized protein n=1 Tax=Lignipirellula cremea TaxID=2528010 RepID=A0A518DU37_9BACT|nr:hypothetical protein [Lignipirellula cremea]QDU95346.1 hypothetical protein Pla8534_31610 [Lignipirellula cremea]